MPAFGRASSRLCHGTRHIRLATHDRLTVNNHAGRLLDACAGPDGSSVAEAMATIVDPTTAIAFRDQALDALAVLVGKGAVLAVRSVRLDVGTDAGTDVRADVQAEVGADVGPGPALTGVAAAR